ncbi:MULTISPECIES: Imm7 family immunity protein [unclassified Streptomyces]|uniref:Imm7 family immunity protein n=1 Tax=unclassified Streptomyces TaxID=2593676 RepID=UPI002E2F1A12|nr:MULTISPECIES: Imm7 family immunity protein [unclassified Streptomyces]
MFEYHGWITLRETAGDDDASPYLLDLRWMNGEPFIHLGGHSNHRSSPDAVALFEYVATVAPGSYGLLHIRDGPPSGRCPVSLDLAETGPLTCGLTG